MTPEEIKAFCDHIRKANAEAVEKLAQRQAEWREKFPGKPLPHYLRFKLENRYEGFLKKLESKSAIESRGGKVNDRS